MDKRLANCRCIRYNVEESGDKWEKVERRTLIRRSAVIPGLEQMFLGRHEHTIDEKGRLTIPAKFRELIADGAYVTRGFDTNLLVLTPTSFEIISQRVRQMSITDQTARLLKRLIFSSAERVEVDRNGRILIPQWLRASVGIEKTAVVVGAGEYFEIWAPEQWAAQDEKLLDSDANAARFSPFEITL